MAESAVVRARIGSGNGRREEMFVMQTAKDWYVMDGVRIFAATAQLFSPRCARDLIGDRDARFSQFGRPSPSGQLEALKADRKGQHSIRINQQWRVCFRCSDGEAFDVEIADYHH